MSVDGMDALQVGVVGVGKLGFHHARLFRTLPEVAGVRIYDSDLTRMGAVAEELGVEACEDADQLFDLVDAAVIAVPTPAHEKVALAALERGVHVLVEKPLADTIEAADRILDAADASGAVVQTGHVERFNGALRACEAHLDGPVFVESHRLAPFDPRGTDVAVVLDLMIHDLDLVLSLIGRPVTDLRAVGVPVLTDRVDIANARLEFEGGAVANLTASRVSRERKRKIRFFQPSGYISLDLAAGTGEFLRLRPEFALDSNVSMNAGADPGAAGAAARAGAGGVAGAGFTGAAAVADAVDRIPLESDGAEPLRRELESFVAAVLGRGPVTVSGRAGRQALAVALEIMERMDARVAHTNPA